MVPKTQTDSHIAEGEDERQDSRIGNSHDNETAETTQSAARELAASLEWLRGAPSYEAFSQRGEDLTTQFKAVFERVNAAFAKAPDSEDLLWLRDNAQELSSAASMVANELAPLTRLPLVSHKNVSGKNEILPRVLAIAQAFLPGIDSHSCKTEFTAFCIAFEEITPLEFHEIGALVPALKLVLLEQIAAEGDRLVNGKTGESAKRITTSIRIFRHITQTSWKDELESLIPFDKILREDPAGAYAAMDIESRNVYREKIAKLANRIDRTVLDVAKEALALARQAHAKKYDDPRIALREAHIGYYLVSEGETVLRQRVGFNPTFDERLRLFLRRYPDDFLVLGVVVLTLAVITGAVWLLTPASTSPLLVLLSLLVLLLPGSQAAVQLMNYLTTNLMPVEALPKLDFSEGIPNDCVTMVAIPTLLLTEKQVQGLVENLEVRFLGNHDRNLHFAIVSDLPDSDQPAPEESSLVALCSKLISELNERYSGKTMGSFFLLHRHRVYNPREGGWMGWERKRGKLLDLNQLMRGQYDS